MRHWWKGEKSEKRANVVRALQYYLLFIFLSELHGSWQHALALYIERGEKKSIEWEKKDILYVTKYDQMVTSSNLLPRKFQLFRKNEVWTANGTVIRHVWKGRCLSFSTTHWKKHIREKEKRDSGESIRSFTITRLFVSPILWHYLGLASTRHEIQILILLFGSCPFLLKW